MARAARDPVPTLEELLSFERACTQFGAAAKNRLIRLQLGISPVRYVQLLHRYIDQPEALGFSPVLVMSLRRLRDQRRSLREARPAGSGYQRSLFDAEPGAVPLPISELLELLPAGEQLREIGMGLADEAASAQWKAKVDKSIGELARRRGLDGPLRFTAEDVRPVVGDPPEGTSPNAMGPRFMAASRRGLIRKVGSRNARRAPLHSHPIAVWIGTGKGET